MVKAHQVAAARFVTEVAPPQVVPVMRRRKQVGLDTIAEDDREHLAYGPSSPDYHQGFAAAWSRRVPARERAAGGLMKDLSNRLSDCHGGMASSRPAAAGRVATS